MKHGDGKIIKLVLSFERASEMIFRMKGRSLRKESLLKSMGIYVCSVHCIHCVPEVLVTPTVTSEENLIFIVMKQI